jgi:putative PIN family toxin of toxin-antitoxin system
LIVVLDTSVWISALEFGSTPLQALDLVAEQFQIAVCESIQVEIQYTLAGKFGWPQAEIDAALAYYGHEAIFIKFTDPLKRICRDPNDDMVLECGVLAGADFIISGDKDLLTIGNYEGIKILSPREFLDLHETGNSSS